MNTFDTYNEAYDHAREKARFLNLNIAIRKVKEFGKTRFVVSCASKMDSDYARAEIVRPDDPFVINNVRFG